VPQKTRVFIYCCNRLLGQSVAHILTKRPEFRVSSALPSPEGPADEACRMNSVIVLDSLHLMSFYRRQIVRAQEVAGTIRSLRHPSPQHLPPRFPGGLLRVWRRANTRGPDSAQLPSIVAPPPHSSATVRYARSASIAAFGAASATAAIADRARQPPSSPQCYGSTGSAKRGSLKSPRA